MYSVFCASVFCLSIHLLTLGCFSILVFVNNAAMKLGVQTSVLDSHNSFCYILRNGMAGSCSNT